MLTEVARLPEAMVEDVADMLAQRPTLTTGQAMAGLRGGLSARVWPSSKRRWRLSGRKGDFETALEASGFEIRHEERGHRRYVYRIVRSA